MSESGGQKRKDDSRDRPSLSENLTAKNRVAANERLVVEAEANGELKFRLDKVFQKTYPSLTGLQCVVCGTIIYVNRGLICDAYCWCDHAKREGKQNCVAQAEDVKQTSIKSYSKATMSTKVAGSQSAYTTPHN
jgi:hypothetical protein